MSNAELIKRLREPGGLENDHLQSLAADALESADARIADLDEMLRTMQEFAKTVQAQVNTLKRELNKRRR